MKELLRRFVLSLSVVAVVSCGGCAGLPKHLTKVQRITQPPPGKALVNFHRPSNWGGAELFAIFDGNGEMLIDLPGGSEFQQICDPGEHIYFAWADQVTVVKSDLAANKVYDIMVDIGMGWVRGNIRLVPLNKDSPRRVRLAEFEKRERQILAQNRTDHVANYEAKHKERIEQIKQDFLGGQKSERVSRLRQDDCR